MKRNRRRLFLAIFIIIAYMLSALTWWTFALIRSQEKIFEKEISTIEIKRELAIEYAVEWLLLKDSEHSNSSPLVIHKHIYHTDTAALSRILSEKFSDLSISYNFNRQLNVNELCLSIVSKIKSQLIQELNAKRRAWILEGLTLGLITIIIGAAMFFYVDKIIRLNMQQTNFLLAVTHELKTPISATKLALQTIVKKKDHGMLDKLIGIAQSNMSRLSKMVDQVLLATKFESKFIDPVFQIASVDQIILKTIEDLELPENSRDLLNLDIDAVDAEIDESMLQVVIRNLITNSLKYGEGKPVSISLKKGDNRVQLKVADMGMGIDDSDKKHVFQKFYRVGDEKTRTQPGSGLGLYLVKQITDIHKGKISLENNDPSGSIFSINIPLTQTVQA
ncbi:MAG: HAMP domain-containing sensor histidine kinase [Bacteroidia bacterium]|nr:HAMP domain-containing sensor histidine kinase [Bacteroidia bacterium]